MEVSGRLLDRGHSDTGIAHDKLKVGKVTFEVMIIEESQSHR